MKISQFHIKIQDSNIVFKSEDHKTMFKRWLAQWEGQDISLEVSTRKSKRSYEQNRYYWLYLNLIQDETGNKIQDTDTEGLHSYFKGKFLTIRISEIYGDKYRVTKSTSDLSKGEFCSYLIDISNLTGVELPDTTEYFGSSYHK